tara:strand:- start:15066 stop:15221 length:156 start_codon:yes stop_codon:yes gene_type:complete
LKKKNLEPEYIKKLLESFPKIRSGRKNSTDQHRRIIRTIKLIKEILKKSNN